MRNPRSFYVRRKQAKKPCQGCGSSDIEALVCGAGAIFRCRSCLGSWAPGIRGFHTRREIEKEIFG